MMPLEGDHILRRDVRQLTLIKRRVPSGQVAAQIGNLAREVRVELTMALEGKGSLGVLRDIRDGLLQNRARALVYEGIEFEAIDALVRIGSSYRKVGVIGIDHNSGVVDLSDDVQRDGNEYPLFESIDRQVRDILPNYLREFRDR